MILHNKMGILSEQWIQKLADMQLFEPRKKHSTETKELKWYQYLLEARENIEINGKPANSFE